MNTCTHYLKELILLSTVHTASLPHLEGVSGILNLKFNFVLNNIMSDLLHLEGSSSPAAGC